MADDIFVSNDIELDVDFGEVFVIDQGVVTKVVAKKYDPTKTYIVGEYVIQQDKLYRCITAIETPEEFDSEKWTRVLLADEVETINTTLPTKADKSDTYTKEEVNTALALKADKSTTYTKTEVDTALSVKANSADVDVALSLKADKEDTYTKSEVDNSLALKADKADTYTKGDVNDYLALKADKSDTYTKSEVDTALNAKADSDSVYDKSETYSKVEVDNKINNLPAPMIMKGTLGTGGTITDLPTASSENEGFTYKVITDGTYAGQTAKTGDVFTSAKPVGSSDYIWLYIPSGDETFTDTWRGIKVNGTEKLGSAISSGEVDFTDGTNTTVTFNPTGNKIKVDVDGYTQAQVDSKLSLKANTADVYNKSAVDSALALKANTADVYNKTTADEKYALKADKATTYTKTEVNDIVDLVKTASGNPCNFETDIADTLVSLKAAIVASGGNGTPSTPIPIVGHSELNLVRCGKNFVSDTFADGLPSTTIGADYNTITPTTRYGYINLDIHGTTVTLSMQKASEYHIEYFTVFGYVANKLVQVVYINTYSGQAVNLSGFEKIRIVIGCQSGYEVQSNYGSLAEIQVEIGSQATAYEPYNGTPYLVSFGQTVYGGEYDANSGKLTDTFGNDNLADLNWTYSSGDGWFQVYHNTHKHPASGALCSCYPVVYALGGDFVDKSIAVVANYLAIKDSSFGGNVNALKTALAGQTLCYELATPIEIDVSSISVEAVVGVNNIVSDCNGDITVEYEVGGLANDVKTVIGTTKFADLSDIPNPPTTDGNYRLIVTITDGKPTYSWEEIP